MFGGENMDTNLDIIRLPYEKEIAKSSACGGSCSKCGGGHCGSCGGGKCA